MQGVSCGAGCGQDRYWGDFYSDPPDCWDPCDQYGNYTGGSGKCHTCGGKVKRARYSEYNEGAVVESDEGVVTGEHIVSQSDRVVGPAPTPAKQPHKATKQ
jgi:hypothetical protein